MNYYNEIDPHAAQWLRNLIAAGCIAPGDVDERSIEDVTPNEIRGYTQCHFFAGIGGWAYALDLAGWPRDRPVWTGSCPCQPFSAAGKGAGFEDERHLWPAWQHLIAQCRPPIVFGEQVASKAADEWIDLIHADLEGMGYAFGCVPFPAASVGAPHIRDRNYWLGHACSSRSAAGLSTQAGRHEGFAGVTHNTGGELPDGGRRSAHPGACNDGLADAQHDGHNRPFRLEAQPHCDESNERLSDGNCAAIGLGHADRAGCEARDTFAIRKEQGTGKLAGSGVLSRPGPVNGQWRDADWLGCRDGKWRPVEPGSFPLLDGLPGRVGRLRAYGNAIVAPQAAEFVASYLEAEGFTAIEAAA